MPFSLSYVHRQGLRSDIRSTGFRHTRLELPCKICTFVLFSVLLPESPTHYGWKSLKKALNFVHLYFCTLCCVYVSLIFLMYFRSIFLFIFSAFFYIFYFFVFLVFLYFFCIFVTWTHTFNFFICKSQYPVRAEFIIPYYWYPNKLCWADFQSFAKYEFYITVTHEGICITSKFRR